MVTERMQYSSQSSERKRGMD